MERVTPDSEVGVDYAGPVYMKRRFICKPTIVKTYIFVLISLSVKAVHWELVSDITTDAFIAARRRFVARSGKPYLIWSDHNTVFIGTTREIKEFVKFLGQQKTQGLISKLSSESSYLSTHLTLEVFGKWPSRARIS